jgi:hypothetical protein
VARLIGYELRAGFAGGGRAGLVGGQDATYERVGPPFQPGRAPARLLASGGTRTVTTSVVAAGTSYGEHRDGRWRAGVPDWAAGRWCDV